MPDGKSILSGWTDGKIRCFLPQSGKLLWILNDAHAAGNKDYGGVLTLCATQDCANVLSGGADGEVRLWDIGKQTKKLQSAQKVHKGAVTSVLLIDEGTCASSSTDNSIIIWQLQKHQILQKLRHISVGEEAELGIIGMLYVRMTNNLVSIDGEKKVSYINLDTMRIEK